MDGIHLDMLAARYQMRVLKASKSTPAVQPVCPVNRQCTGNSSLICKGRLKVTQTGPMETWAAFKRVCLDSQVRAEMAQGRVWTELNDTRLDSPTYKGRLLSAYTTKLVQTLIND